MLSINRLHAALFFAGVAVVSVLLGLLDASWTLTKVVGATMSALAVLLLFRHRDESVDPPLDVLAWRVGFRGRKLPQLLASIEADNRR